MTFGWVVIAVMCAVCGLSALTHLFDKSGRLCIFCWMEGESGATGSGETPEK